MRDCREETFAGQFLPGPGKFCRVWEILAGVAGGQKKTARDFRLAPLLSLTPLLI